MKLLSLSALALALAAQTAAAAPVQWTIGSGGNGHWYELLGGSVDHATAVTTATNLGGYLVTITSAAEQAFLNTVVNPGSVLSWIGLSDAAVEGTFVWDEPTGPVTATWTNWSGGEPNNLGNEDYVHAWWGANGSWNDIYPSYGSAVLVEYSPVPVPAALPLLGAGIASLVALRRRKKA
jgi:hypothetical protein